MKAIYTRTDSWNK